MVAFDKSEVQSNCEEVRSDENSTNWATFVYDGNKIVFSQTGEDYDELFDALKANDDRVFGFIRVQTGDEMSIRRKFAVIIYYGSKCSPIAKAKCSTEKNEFISACGTIVTSFLMDGHVLTYEEILEEIKKAGGANYDAQA